VPKDAGGFLWRCDILRLARAGCCVSKAKRLERARGEMRQFSLRSMLVFTAMIAVALAWLLRRPPTRTGFEVHVRGGHAITVDAETGRVWRGPIADSDPALDDSE